MLKSTPVIVIDDDVDDHEMMQYVFTELKIQSEVRFFYSSDEAWHYLKTTTDTPFLIFCDVNLPKQNGLELKKQIDDDPFLRKKSIPFVFYSTSCRQEDIDKAYATLTIQGFFEKPANIESAKQLVKIILSYWYHCKHPNAFLQQTTIRT